MGVNMLYILKLLKNKKGQSIVELAIVLPILLIILMGIFEFGRVMNAYMVITNASREGARLASVGESYSTVIEKIETSTYPLDVNKLQINISPSELSKSRGDSVKVNITYDIDIIIPVIQNLVPNPMHLESQTTMRIE